jgi:hypothetical protein
MTIPAGVTIKDGEWVHFAGNCGGPIRRMKVAVGRTALPDFAVCGWCGRQWVRPKGCRVWRADYSQETNHEAAPLPHLPAGSTDDGDSQPAPSTKEKER